MAAKAPTAQLFVFDSRRGNREESEHEKILAYHPADTSADDQASNAGLLQGIQVFASTFGQVRRGGRGCTSLSTGSRLDHAAPCRALHGPAWRPAQATGWPMKLSPASILCW